jgi:prophage tail gpP-like protein
MMAPLRTGARARWFLAPAATAVLLSALVAQGTLLAAGPAANVPQVEIKKHTTGKEATITHGDREWYIYIDVDDNRTMIIRTESKNGKETKNAPEIVERPMSNAEVDRVINDWASGIKSTLKP